MQLTIPYLKLRDNDPDIEQVSAELNSLEKHLIAITPWENYQDKPEVKFALAHSGKAILLKYWVSEKTLIAVHRLPNEPVYKDSCVEFFILFNNDKDYYNFEFNCVGTCLAATGPDRQSREFLPIRLIEKIKVKSLIKSASNGMIQWELCLIIPIETFNKHQLDSFENLSCRMNLYKCGDDLPEPHFLTWNNIVSEIPNFHLSEFFGKAQFASIPESKLKETLTH